MIMLASWIPQKTSKEEMEILSIRDQLWAMGGNNIELWAIQKILGSLRRGDIAAVVALERARRILSSVQDYH